jgi:hypothetical protein
MTLETFDTCTLVLAVLAALCFAIPAVLALSDTTTVGRHRLIERRKPRARLAIAAALLAVSAEHPIVATRPAWRTVQIGASA